MNFKIAIRARSKTSSQDEKYVPAQPCVGSHRGWIRSCTRCSSQRRWWSRTATQHQQDETSLSFKQACFRRLHTIKTLSEISESSMDAACLHTIYQINVWTTKLRSQHMKVSTAFFNVWSCRPPSCILKHESSYENFDALPSHRHSKHALYSQILWGVRLTFAFVDWWAINEKHPLMKKQRLRQH